MRIRKHFTTATRPLPSEHGSCREPLPSSSLCHSHWVPVELWAATQLSVQFYLRTSVRSLARNAFGGGGIAKVTFTVIPHMQLGASVSQHRIPITYSFAVALRWPTAIISSLINRRWRRRTPSVRIAFIFCPVASVTSPSSIPWRRSWSRSRTCTPRISERPPAPRSGCINPSQLLLLWRSPTNRRWRQHW